MAETDLRPTVMTAIRDLKRDPTDKDAMALIVGFAEASELVHITIQSEFMPFLGKDDFKGDTNLLAGFVAGNMQAQFKELDFQNHFFEGVHKMLQIYKALRTKGAVDHEPNLEKWSKLKNDELYPIIQKIVGAEEAKEK